MVGSEQEVDAYIRNDVERRARSGVYGGGDLLRPRAGGKKSAAPASSMTTSSPHFFLYLVTRVVVSVAMLIFLITF
ncbi:hypothetical protein LINPERPRIM_LOCUS33696 [Linum perenne]